MKTLTSSSSKIFADKYRDGGFLLPKDFLSRPENRFLKYQNHFNVGFSHLISLQHKTIHPVFSSSSVSSESQAAFEEAETQNQEINQSKTVHVKFQLQKECVFGEQFLIVGDDPMFGLWDPSNAVPLDWSEGHVWSVELDIPIRKSIQFKFLLKGNTGNIQWQPGPDRILCTWETKNTITVYEDWENAEIQKIIEEGPIANQNEESIVNSEMLIENLTQPKEEQINETSTIADTISSRHLTQPKDEQINETSTIADTISSPDENITYPNEKPMAMVAENITYPNEKPMAMVAENITYPNEKPLVKVNDTVLGAKSIMYPKEEPMAMIIENALGSNGKAATVKNPASIEDEENPVTHKGSLVLVPGLTPLSTLPTEEAPPNEDERSIAVNASVEAKDHNVPEFKEEQEPDCDPQPEGTTKMMINDEEELHDSELEPKPHLAEEINDNVVRNDIQWGRKTLQKLLASLGFL